MSHIKALIIKLTYILSKNVQNPWQNSDLKEGFL